MPSLPPGTVIRAFVQFTRPPKEKRFVIIGTKDDDSTYGVVLINSEVNPNVNSNFYLASQHYSLTKEGRSYLTHDSFIDCTDIFQISKTEIESIISLDAEVIKGDLNEYDLDQIILMLKNSALIKGKIKKKFGLFD